MTSITVTLSPIPQSSVEINIVIRAMSDAGYTERGWADNDAMNFEGMGTDLPVQTLARHGVASIAVKRTHTPHNRFGVSP